MTLALTLSVAGCSDGSTSNSGGVATDVAGPTAAADPSYRLLSKEELTGALLALQDVPAGYSQDPPPADGPGKTFCDYPPPFEEKVKVRRDFTKGAGLSAEFLGVGLRQYADDDQARASFDALATALESCTGETYNGVENTYAAMSAPDVGDATLGVKITADGVGLLQFFAVVGPVLVNTGGGGLMNANADEVMRLLEAQVKKYEGAAGP